HQRSGAIDHRGIHYLTFARTLGFERGADDTERQQHAAAAEIADEVDRRHRLLAFDADGVQRAGQRDVVDVVTGGFRHRTVLTPAGHAAIDQFRIALEADIRTKAETFGDAGTIAFVDHVGLVDQFQQGFQALGGFQVDDDALAVALQRISRVGGGIGALDGNDFRAHVAQHHAAERTWADAQQFNHFQTCQRTHRYLPTRAKSKNKTASLHACSLLVNTVIYTLNWRRTCHNNAGQ